MVFFLQKIFFSHFTIGIWFKLFIIIFLNIINNLKKLILYSNVYKLKQCTFTSCEYNRIMLNQTNHVQY